MASVREWQFKRKFRTNAYGWRASSLAIGRLKEAAAEIRSVAKSDPIAAGDGVVSLMERIWPAFQGIDTSSGALGAAVLRAVNELIPILTVASADHATRGKWLERLFEAVQSDGVEYLAPLEDRWGEIAQYPDLIDEYADRMIGMVRRAWADHQTCQHVIGTSVCLSCLLEGGRYDELQELLATRRIWYSHRFGAEALVRQGLWEAAIAFAEAARSSTNPGFSEMSIDRFCEKLLIDHGRADEAYRRYGLRAVSGTTNLSVYRSLVRTYPDRDHRRMLLDLIEARSADVQSILDAQTETWGIKVSTVEFRTVELTENMVRAIAKQAEAERDRRAKVIHAEAEFQASQTLVNAAKILGSIPAAMQLRYLQTLTEIGAEQNSTVVFPMPIDIMKPFLEMIEKVDRSMPRPNGSDKATPTFESPLEH
jgi:hypothetical protein